MNGQQCKKCGSEWNSAIKSVSCPFCGAAMIDESKKFSTIEEVFEFVFSEYGVEIINEGRKFMSLLGDYAPGMENERRLVKIAIEAEVYKALLSENDKDESERNICIDKMVAKLQQQCFLSNEWSQKVVAWFAGYLHWNLPFNIMSSSPISFTNISHSISNTGFDPVVYEMFTQDPDYIAGQKEDRAENYSEALRLYETAYNKGNLLAGVKLAMLYGDGRGTEMSKEKAYHLFSVTQKKGDPLAKAWISEYYRMGFAVPQDKAKAKEILENCASDLEQMCACGDADAQYYLGYEYLYGLSLPKDERKAFELLKKAYAAGVISAGVALADCYFKGIGCAIDEKWAVALLEACVKSSNKKAHYELGKLYYYGKHVKEDNKRAFSLFLFAAERGHKSSQDYVGDCYYYGQGVERDYVKAREWYLKAYDNGDSHAASQLGRIYYNGFGVEEDDDKAFYYFSFAAQKDNNYAKYMLQYFYLVEGKYKDHEKGIEYLMQAAEDNYTDAQVIIGKFYVNGQYGLEESEEKSYQWLLKAAEQGHAEAERIIGEMYTQEYYVVQNPTTSREWLEKAISHGDYQAYCDLAKLYMEGRLGDVNYRKGEELLDACVFEMDKEPWELNRGRNYEKVAEAFYTYGKKQSSADKDRFVYKSTVIYKRLYLNGRSEYLYDYAWGVFIEDAFVEEKDFEPYKLLSDLKNEAKIKESSKCAVLLSKLYEEGSPRSTSMLRLHLQNKKAVYEIKSDPDESEKWIKIAIQNGDMDAACKFAIKLCNKLKRPNEAFEYAKLAHEQGNFQGTFLLGNCYKSGIGVKKDRTKAKELLKLAKANGYS